jgi:hypothetical protein
MSNSSLNYSEIIFSALENERQLDCRYREVFKPQGNYLNYKIMKQEALRSKLGIALAPMLYLLAYMMPIIILLTWLKAFVLSFRSRELPQNEGVVWLIPTTPTNVIHLRDAIATDSVEYEIHLIEDLIQFLAPRLGPNSLLHIFPYLLGVIRKSIFGQGHTVELLLHARDALNFLLLANFAEQRCKDIFISDDHYQRWAYVLSHSANRFYLVQHGTLDHSIIFPFHYGKIEKAYIFDDQSLQTFGRYYREICTSEIRKPILKLKRNKLFTNCVFLASSFPSLEQEVEVIKELRRLNISPIIIKFHPVHNYGNRKKMLIEWADYVCEPDENPSCRVFISYSSSMELIYQNCGIPTVSIKQQGSIGRAAEAVRNYLTVAG